jgi:hypothetical protein
MVTWTRVATRERVCILVEHVEESTEDDPGAVLEFDNPMAQASESGYFIVGGDRKVRGTFEQRYQPPILGALVEAQNIAYVRSALLSQALAEAARTPYQADDGSAMVPPLDSTQEQKSKTVKDGTTPPMLRGQILRVPDTGLNLVQLDDLLDKRMERYRSREFFSGTGSSSETGIHLARTQTAFLTHMVPYQVMRASARKRILQALLKVWAAGKETVYIPFLPGEGRGASKEIRVVKPREITPEMAKMPVDLRITIGAESPETKYAREQAVRENVNFGLYGMTTGRETIGVKNPTEEVRKMAIDNLVFNALGTKDGPGWAVQYLSARIKQRTEEYLNASMPPALTTQATTPAGVAPASKSLIPPPQLDTAAQPVGEIPPGAARPNPPVQTIDGAPVGAGAAPMPV